MCQHTDPGIRHRSGRPMEVDLLCAEDRIAVELDGYYHFQEEAAYRRDREKDWLLQRAGWLVLRFLSDDVVPKLERILSRIDAARRHRRYARVDDGGSDER